MSSSKEVCILKIVCAITLFVVLLEGVGLVLLWKHNELEIELIREDIDSLKMTISSIQEKSHRVIRDKRAKSKGDTDPTTTVCPCTGQKGDPGEPGQLDLGMLEPLIPFLKGPPGAPGSQGQPGRDGRDGRIGSKGEMGDPGIAGAPGHTGEKGAPGPKGGEGAPGPKGEEGAPGPKGEEGAPGPKGMIGPQGFKGEKGEMCNQGPKGQPTYRFEKLTNTIEEDDEFVEVCILREGTLNNTDIVTVEGTSSDGETVASGDMDVGDSMAESGDFGDPKDVVFPPMSTRECINFDITPDDEDEEEEEFQLILTSALQGLQDSTSIVVIRDMDGDMIGD